MKSKYHTCSKECQTKYCIKYPSKTYLMELHWKRDMPLKDISAMLGICRSTLTRYIKKSNIPYRTLSEDNKRRYKYMSNKQIKEQTKGANRKCREMVSNSEWHLQVYGEDHPNYKHGLAHTQAYHNTFSALYRSKRKKQTPELTQEEKARIETLYRWSQELGSEFHVDHFEPLSKSGLHHPDNLQIIPAKENLSKNNKSPEDYYGRFYDFIKEGHHWAREYMR